MYAGFSTLAQGGDVASYVSGHYDPEIEYQPVEEGELVRGHDELSRWNARWFEAWDVFEAEIDEIAGEGDRMMAGVTVQGRGGESGTEISQRIFHAFEIRDGRIRRMSEFLDRDEALEAAGLG